jgi:hypothetical protein
MSLHQLLMGVIVQIQIALFLTLFLSLTFSAMGMEKVLCDVSSDLDTDYAKIVYEYDGTSRGIKHLYQDAYHAGVRTGRIELKSDGLKEGIILNQKDKIITVRMYSNNYDNEQGGVLYLDTLYNGVSGERREYVMEVAMDKTGPVLIQNRALFTKMKFIAKRSKVLGVIGIEKVLFGN